MRFNRRLLGTLLIASLSMLQYASAAPRVRVGAICNDGTTSKATGSDAWRHDAKLT